jgi:hypothetical protein
MPAGGAFGKLKVHIVHKCSTRVMGSYRSPPPRAKKIFIEFITGNGLEFWRIEALKVMEYHGILCVQLSMSPSYLNIEGESAGNLAFISSEWYILTASHAT